MDIGEVYGKYRLMERIAVGGMAEVYKAMAMGEAGFEKPVAIKRLHRQFGDDEDLVGMLQDEARLCSQLNHGNICQVLDLGRMEDTYYIAMEYVNGKDLFHLLRKAAQGQRKLPLPGALYIACEMLAGLDYAHRKCGLDGEPLHIIHRDISPQNVLITYDGEVKIIDFGIAKARTSTHKTQAGVIKGKFRYMSPEQARGEPIDHRTDIFATGVVLYEMITGKPHAAGATDREVLIKIQRGNFDPLSQLVLGLPAELEGIVHQSLTLEPEGRWSTSRAMRKALITYMRSNGLVFSRDDLAEYVRALYIESTGKGTQVDQIESLDSNDLSVSPSLGAEPDPFEPRPVAPDNDPFAPGLAPVVTVGLSAPPAPTPVQPNLAAAPPAAAQAPAAAQPTDTPQATVALRESRMPAGLPVGPPANRPPQSAASRPRPNPAPAPRTATPAAQAPRTTDPQAQAATVVSDTLAGRGRPSALLAFGRFVVLLVLLGLMGVGGYYAYILHIKKPDVRSVAKRQKKTGKRHRRKPLQVKASLEIDSRPRGARIFLSGQDVQVKTPGSFPDYTVPTRLLVELRHKRFKKSWRKIIHIGPGDLVKFVADLRHPPSNDEKTSVGGKLRRTYNRRRGRPRPAGMTQVDEPTGLAKTDIAHLAVVANVKGADVFINGRRRGKTPFFRKVRPATFRVQVRFGKRRSEVQTVTLRPGGDEVVRFSLGN